MLQGRIWGNRVLQDVLWCRHKGSRKLLLWVRGVRDRAGFRDRVLPLPPRRGAAPPPPPSLRRRAGRAQELGNAARGAGQRVGQTDSGAPRSTGMRQPVCRPAGGGGFLSLRFTRQVQSSGGGGRPTLHSRTCCYGLGRGSAQPEIWARSLLGGSHIGWRPRSFCRAAMRSGGRGGKGLNISVYSCI